LVVSGCVLAGRDLLTFAAEEVVSTFHRSFWWGRIEMSQVWDIARSQPSWRGPEGGLRPAVTLAANRPSMAGRIKPRKRISLSKNEVETGKMIGQLPGQAAGGRVERAKLILRRIDCTFYDGTHSRPEASSSGIRKKKKKRHNARPSRRDVKFQHSPNTPNCEQL
jgi:hypothetical protein